MIVYKCVRPVKVSYARTILVSFNTPVSVQLNDIDNIIVMDYTPPRKVFGCYGPLFAFKTAKAATDFLSAHRYRNFEIWEAKARPSKLQTNLLGNHYKGDYDVFWKSFKDPTKNKDYFKELSDFGYVVPAGNIYCDWIKLVRRVGWTGERHNL